MVGVMIDVAEEILKPFVDAILEKHDQSMSVNGDGTTVDSSGFIASIAPR